MQRILRVAAVVLAFATVVTACSTDKKPVAAPAAWWKGVAETDMRGKAEGDSYPKVLVDAKDNTFSPQIVRVDPGVTVEFKNEGGNIHNVLKAVRVQSFGPQFGVDSLAVGSSYEFAFEKEGVYRIFCSLHGNEDNGMVGMVVVGAAKIDEELSRKAIELKQGTLKVPQDYKTIQSAVDSAAPGSMVLVDKGVYNEAVFVNPGHENIVIRGTSRNDVILDGKFDKAKKNGFLVQADGVAIENITAKNYVVNNFFWTGVKGYRGSYLTSIRSGDYGVYAFDSIDGQFDHVYASGSRDAGLYIGQCTKCNAVVTDFVSEWNGIGFSGTNAGGDLYLINSTWRFNRIGIVPNSGTGETMYPQRNATIVGNRVYSNNNKGTSAIDIATIAFGNGILLAGANDNIVERNLVFDHDVYGIAAIPLPETVIDPDNEKAVDFDATNNAIRDNAVSDSRIADLAAITSITAPNDSGKNCFSGNVVEKANPANIQTVLACGSAAGNYKSDLANFVTQFTDPGPPEVDWKLVKLPTLDRFEEMPDALTSPVKPANVGVPMKIDLAAITLPTR